MRKLRKYYGLVALSIVLTNAPAEAGSLHIAVPLGNMRAFLSRKDSDAVSRIPEAPRSESPFAALEHIAESVPVGSSNSVIGLRAHFDDGTNVIAGVRTDHGNRMFGIAGSKKF